MLFVLRKWRGRKVSGSDGHENKKVKTSIPKELVIENDEYDDDSNENNKTIDIFDLENDYVKTFYIGSITVVGLYILYRILDKSK